MLPTSVAVAITFFESRPQIELTREAVMAYSTLRAVEHYYPDLLSAQMTDYLQAFSWIRSEEPGRVLKQKRIMSWIISRELNDQSSALKAKET